MDKYTDLLRKYWGYDDFRGIQREIIESIGQGRDTLGLMPTGGGKSITFQVPALAMKGMCIVVTPLISLMKDQVEALRRHGIKAAYINSSLSHEQILTTLENSIFGAYKFLYISPERIGSSLFQEKVRRMKVCFITVDEAHCISQWGYDFRPSYLKIADLRKLLPDCPILALTATATPEVARDIQHILLFREENLHQMSFARQNLSYCVIDDDDALSGVLRLLDGVPGSCIVYCRNRDKCRTMAKELAELGHSATFYHAGLRNSEKDERQEAWRKGEIRIMVATNAFGMGIDKPDVRLVAHIDMPDSIEEYFQEAGRAGRDGKKSYAVFIRNGKEHIAFKRRITQQFPDIEFVRQVYEMLCCNFCIAVGDGMGVTRELNIERFCQTFHFFPTTIVPVLELLTMGGYIDYLDEDEASSRIMIPVTRTELFRNTDPLGERIMMSILRHVGGLFVDYTAFDEDIICRETSLTLDQIYQTLLDLDRKHLIAYIPRKRLPRIVFVQRRVDREDIHLSKAVYHDRRERFGKRIEAMYNYINSTDTCRSRLLLQYFGEEAEHDCGICDVCIANRNKRAKDNDFNRLHEYLLSLHLKDTTQLSELDLSAFPQDTIDQVLAYMAAKEEI